MLHARASENLLFSPKRETSNLSENSKKLPFVSAWVVAQARIFAQARVVLPKLESLA